MSKGCPVFVAFKCVPLFVEVVAFCVNLRIISNNSTINTVLFDWEDSGLCIFLKAGESDAFGDCICDKKKIIFGTGSGDVIYDILLHMNDILRSTRLFVSLDVYFAKIQKLFYFVAFVCC